MAKVVLNSFFRTSCVFLPSLVSLLLAIVSSETFYTHSSIPAFTPSALTDFVFDKVSIETVDCVLYDSGVSDLDLDPTAVAAAILQCLQDLHEPLISASHPRASHTTTADCCFSSCSAALKTDMHPSIRLYVLSLLLEKLPQPRAGLPLEQCNNPTLETPVCIVKEAALS